jgi:diacylglycerol O-acyltransferase / wax synthase
MTGTSPEPLGADDAAILALESPAIAGHTLKLIVLEPGDEPLSLEHLRDIVAARLDAEPRARHRVEEVSERGRAQPCWVADDGFDICAQVRDREGAEGGGDEALWAVASELMSERLDHRRPLWALDLTGPLADGRQAIVARIHHAMADGISSIRFLSAVLWESEPGAAPARSPGRATQPRTPARSSDLRRLPGALQRELGGYASRSPLDRPIGSARALAFTDVPLAELKRIGASRPGHVTVNDVLLAGVSGGLRGWLGSRQPDLPALRAQIPVSLHHRDEGQGQLGNRDSFLNLDLPLAEPDPIARLDRINAETSRRKELGDAEELYDFFHALARFKPLSRAAERLAASPREFSLSISNVPGPRGRVSVAGHRVERLCTVAEPADRHALRVSAISCAGAVGIGLCTDPVALPGVDALATAIDESFAELRAAAAIG